VKRFFVDTNAVELAICSLPVNIIESMTMTVLPLLCFGIQERQFFTSPCLTSNSESQDMESCKIESEDKPPLTVQVNSADDDKVLVAKEV